MDFKDFFEQRSEMPENIVCQKTVDGSSSNAEYVCCPPDLSPCSCKCHEKVIGLKELGEQALEEIIRIKKKWITQKGKFWVHTRTLDLQRIAVACLGEKDVSKILKELKQ